MSGKYEIVDATGTATGEHRYVTGGDPFPPATRAGYEFRLKSEIVTVYTSASSAAAMDETTATFSDALSRLATK